MTRPPPAALSIVIPVLDEAAAIGRLLDGLRDCRAHGAEIVVVDGGSADGTPARAAGLADRVLSAPRGRGRQMNTGAAAAGGDVLLFLHADTMLPPAAPAAIAGAVAGGACWGRFDVRIVDGPRGVGIVAFMMNLRSRLTGIATGDQAIFVTREAFTAVGGFPEQALMEDLVLSDRLRALAPPACLRLRVSTSGRRWRRHGLLRTILNMWWLRLRFRCGASPDRLAREYGDAGNGS